MNDRINRPEYLNKLIQYKDKDVVKIVTGIRRCGKSTLLDLYEDYLLSSGVSEKNVLHMNMESMKYSQLLEAAPFYGFVSSKLKEGEKYYLIFDELQTVNHWEKAVESLRLDFDVDIYITGSNAYLLSSEFSTLLSGRYVEIRLLPLSFKEFLTFYDFDAALSIEDRFQRFMQIGGMPILRQFDFNMPRVNEMLEGIYSTVILKDVLQRNKIADQTTLQKIVLFLCSNIGSITSPNSIGNVLAGDCALEKKGAPPAGRTISRYIEMLEDAFVFYRAGRYDVKGKQLLKTLEKNYIVDLGFRNMLLGYRDAERGHLLENVVYLELLRRDYRVFIGKVGEAEVDFIAERPDEKIYIQVTERMDSDLVRERELRPLRMISDNYEKIVLSMDRSFVASYEGIKVRNLIDFLLGKLDNEDSVPDCSHG